MEGLLTSQNYDALHLGRLRHSQKVLPLMLDHFNLLLSVPGLKTPNGKKNSQIKDHPPPSPTETQLRQQLLLSVLGFDM